MNLINETQVFETWAPILEEKTGIKNSDKLQWMSKYAHYHSLNEGFTYPQASLFNTPGMGNVTPASSVAGGASNFYGAGSKGSGDKFPSLLPLAIQVAARTVGFDIVPVIPMNGPSGVLTYLDYVYAGGRDPFAPGLGNQNPAIGGTGVASSSRFGDKMQVFKLNTLGFDVDALAAFIPTNIGDAFGFSLDNSLPATSTIVATYIGRSRIDGFPLFRVVGEVASLLAGGGTVDVNVAIGQTQTLPFYLAVNGTSTTTIYDVTSYSIQAGTYATAAVLGAGATFNAGAEGYFAELVRGLEDHIQGFAGAGPNDDQAFSGNEVNALTPYEPMRRGVGETSYYRTMGMQAFTKFVEAETFQVAATVTTEQIQDLNRQYGIDVISMMENALVNEISQSINKHILYRAFALGWQNHYNVNTIDGTNFNLQVATSTPATSVIALGSTNNQLTLTIPAFQNFNPGGSSAFENQGTIQRRVQSKMLASANMVAQRGRRGPANFAVCNLQIATALQDSAQFTFYPLANTINQNNGALYPIGTLAGITIYVDPNMGYNDTRVCVGRKGADEEPGLKFMPYLMAESIQTIAEGTMAPKIAVKSRYALVEAGFHPETQYLTFLVSTATTAGVWNSATTFTQLA